MSNYLENKRIRDEIINNLRYQKLKKMKGIKRTKADELRGNVQKAMQRNLDDLTEDYYRKEIEKRKHYHGSTSVNRSSSSLLPKINTRGQSCTPNNETNITQIDMCSQAQKKDKEGRDIVPTKPKYSYMERNHQLAKVKMDQLVNQRNDIGAKVQSQINNNELIQMRIEKQQMLANYYNSKQQMK